MKFSNPRLTSRCVILLTTALALPLLANGNLSAQQFIFQQPAGKNRNLVMYKQFMEQLGNIEQAANSRIECCLRDLDLACQLSDGQRKKLKVACKGAVESFMTHAKEKIKKTALQSGFDFEPGNPPDEVEEDEEQNVAVAQNIVVMNGLGGEENGEKRIENEKTWKMSVKKTLTEKQNQQRQSWVEQRQQNIQQAAVNNFVARVDLKLLLSPEQRTSLAEWVNDQYGKKLAIKFEESQVPQPRFFVLGRNEPKRSDPVISPVATILSESQQEIWSANFQQELDQLEPNIQPAIRAIPAIKLAPAVRIQIDEDN